MMDDQPKSYLSRLAESLQALYDRWFNKESRRERMLPVTIDTARTRLQAAFVSPVTLASGFFFPRYTYAGHIDGDALDIRFTVYGRSAVNYRLHGQLFPHPKGTRLLVKVREESPPFLLLVWMAGGALALSRAGLITMLVLFFPFLVGLPYIAISWHRSVAADNVTSLLWKIIAGRPLKP